MRFVPVLISGGPTSGQKVLFSAWLARKQDYDAFVSETGRDQEPHETVKPVAASPYSFPQYSPLQNMPARIPKPDPNQNAPNAPAIRVNWGDAVAFCAWLTFKDRAKGLIPPEAEYRLPTDHEWSCAAGIGEQEEAGAAPIAKSGQIEGYEWGAAWPPPKNRANLDGSLKRDDVSGLSLVGAFPANRFGLYDMTGNARQWCLDLHDPAKEIVRVLRGASWETWGEYDCKLSTRSWQGPAVRSGTISFRPVLVFPREKAGAAATGEEQGLTVREYLETPEFTALITVKCQGRRVRQEVSISAAGDAVSLFDLDADTAHVVFPAKKLALRATPGEMTASSGLAEKLRTSGKPWTKPVPAGSGAQLGSWKTQTYTSSWGEVPATMWVSDEVPDWKAIRSHLLQLGQALGELGFDPVSLDVPGLAVKTTLRSDSGKMDVMLLSITREHHAASEFSIPAEYAVRPLNLRAQKSRVAQTAPAAAPPVPASSSRPLARAGAESEEARRASTPAAPTPRTLRPEGFRVTGVSLGTPKMVIVNRRSLAEGEEIPGSGGVHVEQVGEDTVVLRLAAERVEVPVQRLNR
jgi:hypothetical protein